jgi:hypothetical protein
MVLVSRLKLRILADLFQPIGTGLFDAPGLKEPVPDQPVKGLVKTLDLKPPNVSIH